MNGKIHQIFELWKFLDSISDYFFFKLLNWRSSHHSHHKSHQFIFLDFSNKITQKHVKKISINIDNLFNKSFVYDILRCGFHSVNFAYFDEKKMENITFVQNKYEQHFSHENFHTPSSQIVIFSQIKIWKSSSRIGAHDKCLLAIRLSLQIYVKIMYDFCTFAHTLLRIEDFIQRNKK